MTKTQFHVEDVRNGDLVDFGAYGKLYVCDATYSDERFWVTDSEDDRSNSKASGWTIEKDLALRIVEVYEDILDDEDDDYEDEDLD